MGPCPEPWALEAQVWGKEANRLLWGLVESQDGDVLGTEAPWVWRSGWRPTPEGTGPSGGAWHLQPGLGAQRETARDRLRLEGSGVLGAKEESQQVAVDQDRGVGGAAGAGCVAEEGQPGVDKPF